MASVHPQHAWVAEAWEEEAWEEEAWVEEAWVEEAWVEEAWVVEAWALVEAWWALVHLQRVALVRPEETSEVEEEVGNLGEDVEDVDGRHKQQYLGGH